MLLARVALQAASGAIVNSHFFQGGLIENLPGSQNRQICLLDASRGGPSALLLSHRAHIYHFWLSALLRDCIAPLAVLRRCFNASGN